MGMGSRRRVGCIGVRYVEIRSEYFLCSKWFASTHNAVPSHPSRDHIDVEESVFILGHPIVCRSGKSPVNGTLEVKPWLVRAPEADVTIKPALTPALFHRG